MKKIRSFYRFCFLMVISLLSFLNSTMKEAHADQTGAVDLNRLMWLGAGAGSKGIVAGMVSGLAPQAGIAPEIGSLFVGFWLAQQGGQWMSPFGEGMLIASVGQLVRQPIEGIFGRIGQPAPPPAPGPTPPTPPAEKTQSPGQDVDTYLAATYGIV